MMPIREGGRLCPPLTLPNRIRVPVAASLWIAAGCVLGAFLLHTPAAHGQGVRFPHQGRLSSLRQRAPVSRQARAPQDPAALELLRRKIRPSLDYAGEQVTELQNGWTSRQSIKGDTK